MSALAELDELRTQLSKAAASPEDDELFYTLVARGLQLTQTTDVDLAEELRVSRPTVTRWKNRQSLAGTALRPTIYGALKKRVDNTLRVLRAYGMGSGSHAPVAAAAKGRD